MKAKSPRGVTTELGQFVWGRATTRTPLASAVVELCGAASSTTVLLLSSCLSPHQAQLCLVVKPDTRILCPAGMKTNVNKPQ